MILDKINSPRDLKKLDLNEMVDLAKEIREGILYRVSRIGGHLGPNLGVVEMTIALHYVFNSPIDKFVFDVSHQSYPHKMLTGRWKYYFDEEIFRKISGFTQPSESEHDFFTIGHTSTSISLANGLAKARDLKNENYNVVAIIGDGSLSGGEAYEGLDNVGELGTNTIVVVNDNDMSIAENHGGLYKHLRELRETDGKCRNNFFESLGFEYFYVEKGNDIQEMIDIFKRVKDADHPVLLHVHTVKGKGYKFAEEDREKFHSPSAFDLETGDLKNKAEGKTYRDITSEYLIEKMGKDSLVTLITAGVPNAIGFSPEIRKKLKGQYVDVGIAEEHAVAMASAMAKNGAKPIFYTNSTFIQRAYDQISHDLCLNNNPAVLLIGGASIYSSKENTHVGFFDIPMISHIPNLTYLAPTCEEELIYMLDWAIDQTEGPVAIRIPTNPVLSRKSVESIDYSKQKTYELLEKGSQVAIMGLGNFLQLGEKIYKELLDKNHIKASLINPRFINYIDEDMLKDLENNHSLLITLEDGVLEGGFGQTIASYLGDRDIKVKNYGAPKIFPALIDLDRMMEENGISINLICKYIVEKLKDISK